MRKMLPMIALVSGFTLMAGSADAGAGRWGNDLHFVAETTVPAPGGTGVMSLCHLVDFMSVLFVPVYTTVEGYALSNDGCTGSMYRDVSSQQVAQMQALGLLPTDIPVEPSRSLQDLLWGHAWLILGGLGILVRGLGMLRGGGRRRAKTPDALAIHSLVAMSQVAIADGRIDDAEVHQIAQILTRLTGKGYGPQQVMEMLQRLNPSAADLAQVGQDLSEKDRQIVLEAALNIAVADGEIHPNEYAVVSDLAQRMRIGSDQFRSALARISAHLQTVQPV